MNTKLEEGYSHAKSGEVDGITEFSELTEWGKLGQMKASRMIQAVWLVVLMMLALLLLMYKFYDKKAESSRPPVVNAIGN